MERHRGSTLQARLTNLQQAVSNVAPQYTVCGIGFMLRC